MKFDDIRIIRGSGVLTALLLTLLAACGGGGSAGSPVDDVVGNHIAYTYDGNGNRTTEVSYNGAGTAAITMPPTTAPSDPRPEASIRFSTICKD